MKNIKYSVIAVIYILSCSYNEVKSQATTLGNFSATTTDFLGWNSGVGFDLNIRHDNNLPIRFSTNGNERMRILQYGNIGIGTQAAQVQPKFMSFLNNGNASLLEDTIFVSTAIYGHNNYSTVDDEVYEHYAIRGFCDGLNPDDPGFWNFGGHFMSRFAYNNVGVEAYVGADSMNTELVGRLGWGVRSIASDHSLSNIGVSGRAAPYPEYLGGFTVGVAGGVDGAGTNMWAGYFQGRTFCTLGVWSASDEGFKDNVEPLTNSLEIINSLNPSSYNYQTAQYPHMQFPEGTYYGVIAQELETVLPELVADINRPNELDNPSDESISSFKAVNYTGLIPILIAGMKEQHSIIEAQNEALAGVMDQLNALQNQMDNCCGGGTGFKNMGTGGEEEEQMQKASPHGNVLNQNTPNPFRTQTTISYTLEQGGKVLLNIFDKTGKPIATLVEAEQAADTYRLPMHCLMWAGSIG